MDDKPYILETFFLLSFLFRLKIVLNIQIRYFPTMMVAAQDIFAIRVDKSHDSEDKGPLDFFEEVACSRISFDY